MRSLLPLAAAALLAAPWLPLGPGKASAGSFSIAGPATIAAGEPSSDSTATGEPAATAPASAPARSRLAPSVEPPWNPPAPVPAAEPWETALRMPLKIVSYPLSLLGQGTRVGLLYMDEHNVVPRVLAVLAYQQRIGVLVTPGSLGDRTGLGVALSVNPPATSWLFADLSGSLKQYSRLRVGIAAGPARLAYRSEWRPEDLFFGIGQGTIDETESNVASRTQAVTLSLDAHREAPLLAAFGTGSKPPTISAGAWVGPRAIVLTDGRDDRVDPLSVQHPAIAAEQLGRRYEHLVYGARLGFDGRSGWPHWARGVRVGFEAERFDQPIEALALRDAHTPARSYTRTVTELEGGVSFQRDPRTLRLLLRAAAVQPDAGPGVLPITDLARLGAGAGLAGFDPGRFSDTHALLGKLSYIFPLAQFFEMDLHAEAGGVFPDYGRSPRLAALEHSFGVALRPRLRTAVLGRVGIDVSREGARIGFSLGGVE